MNRFSHHASFLSALAIGCLANSAHADSVQVDFESYTLGTINAQDGWSRTGNYDHVVAGSLGTAGFGDQSLRISNALTSGSFGDQTFAKPLTDAVGEVDSTDGSFSRGSLQRQFVLQFDLASTKPSAQQPGLFMSMSPDRGDGSRMSYLSFTDVAGGIDVLFFDVQGLTGSDANFVATDLGILDRAVPHHIRLALDTLDGPSNDVVRVWIDDVLVHTGTSWEDYYRFDPESAFEQSPRIVKTTLFRTSGAAVPSNSGFGYLIDNLNLTSGTIPPTDKNQCKNGGWKTFNNPPFKNQGACVSYTNHAAHAPVSTTAAPD